jgi:hypothetical protein
MATDGLEYFYRKFGQRRALFSGYPYPIGLLDHILFDAFLARKQGIWKGCLKRKIGAYS